MGHRSQSRIARRAATISGIALSLALSGCVVEESQSRPTPSSSTSATPQRETPAPPSRTCRDVRVFVTGTANTVMVTIGRGTEITQGTNQPLPLRNSEGLLGFGMGCLPPGTFVSILAQNEGGSGDVECRIEADGTVFSRARSSGGYVIASCSDAVPRR